MTDNPRLSLEASIALNGLKRKTEESSHSIQTLHKEFLTMINRISRSIYDRFKTKDSLNWLVNYDSIIDKNSSVMFEYGLVLKKTSNPVATLTISFNPQGQSFVEGGITPEYGKYCPEKKDLESFFRSPAYKRYFNEHSKKQGQGPQMLKAVVPFRQLSSRYLYDYLVHIIAQMNVFFDLFLSKALVTHLKAA